MKKILSYLLTTVLVMSTMTVGSFALGKTPSSTLDVTLGDSNIKTFVVEFDTDSPNEIAQGVVDFSISNGAIITEISGDVKNPNYKPNPMISNTGPSGIGPVRINNNYGSVFVDGGLSSYIFSFKLDFSNSGEGDCKLNISSNTGINLDDLTVATIHGQPKFSDPMSIYVNGNPTVITDAEDNMSSFEIENFGQLTGDGTLVLELDNDCFFTDETIISVNGRNQFVSSEDSSIEIDIPRNTTSVEVKPYIGLGNSYNDDKVRVYATLYDGYSTRGNEIAHESAIIGSIDTYENNYNNRNNDDYDIEMTVKEENHRRNASLVGGGKSSFEVILTGTNGAITAGRTYDFSVNNASVLNVDTNSGWENTSLSNHVGSKLDDGEFRLTAQNSKSLRKLSFTIEIEADRGNTEDVTISVDSRDIQIEDFVIAEVVSAFEVDSQVNKVLRGEENDLAEITIYEEKAGQLKTGQYLYLQLNEKASFDDIFEITGENGMEFDKPFMVKGSDDSVIGAKITKASRHGKGEINISGLAIDVESGILDKVYSASFLVGDSHFYDNREEVKAEEWAKFDLFKIVDQKASSSSKIIFTLGSSMYTVNSEMRYLEDPVFTQDGRSMLPVGPLAIALGLDVNYNPTTAVATFTNPTNGQVVSVEEGANLLYINSMPVAMYTRATNVDGRIFVPLASITDAFGVTINWNPLVNQIVVN